MNAENMYDAWDNGDRHEIRQQFARREEIIRMAREVGYEADMFGLGVWDSAEFNRFSALVAAAEREACAKVCEGLSGRSYEFDMGRLHSAAAIRARGEKT